MSEAKHYVVIGNGPAGNAAADALREGAPEARVTIISDEPFLYYHRCLLPEYAVGKMEREKLWQRAADEYRARKIHLRLGQKVVDLNTEKRTLQLDHMETVSFDGLVIATGAQPHMPETLLDSMPHIRTLKTLNDADQWRRDLEGCEQVVLVGGDLVSVRFAKRLVEAGKKVTLGLWEEAFWPLTLDDATRAKLVESVGATGVEVVTDGAFQAVEPCGEGRYICRFSNEREVDCALVGGFFGYRPDTAVLGNAGLQLAKGVLVNEHLATDVDGVYVAGDAAQVYSPELKNYWVSVGWGNALALGKVAAQNLLGAHLDAAHAPVQALEVEGVNINTSWWMDI